MLFMLHALTILYDLCSTLLLSSRTFIIVAVKKSIIGTIIARTYMCKYHVAGNFHMVQTFTVLQIDLLPRKQEPQKISI